MARKITYASARNKGKSFERLLAARLVKIGIDAKRVPMSGALSWLKGDVREFGVSKPHVHECKKHEALSINTWWGQALDQVNDGEVPVLHFTSNYKPAYTVMRSVDFDNLIFAYEQRRPELNLILIDIPPRKHFYKFTDTIPVNPYNVFLYLLSEEEMIICYQELYLQLRRQEFRLSQVVD